MIYDHAARPGPQHWSGLCLVCSEPVAQHAGWLARRRWRRRRTAHDRWDLHCEAYVGHNAVPRGVDVYERRCVVCNPYDDAEADELLRSDHP